MYMLIQGPRITMPYLKRTELEVYLATIATSLNNKSVSVFITSAFRICFFINFLNTHDDHFKRYKSDLIVYVLFSSLE